MKIDGIEILQCNDVKDLLHLWNTLRITMFLFMYTKSIISIFQHIMLSELKFFENNSNLVGLLFQRLSSKMGDLRNFDVFETNLMISIKNARVGA